MNYEKFITGVNQLAQQPVPDVWPRIEHSIRPAAIVLPFPLSRIRLLLIAAAFLCLFVLPASLVVANQQHQEMYAYLQNVGSTEYVALASTNY